MKKIVSGSDTIINLELKDRNGFVIPLYNPDIVNLLNIAVTTKGSAEKIVINSLNDIKDNHIKLQSEDLDKLERGQIIIDIYVRFYCEEFSDGYFDYKNKISTNLLLV